MCSHHTKQRSGCRIDHSKNMKYVNIRLSLGVPRALVFRIPVREKCANSSFKSQSFVEIEIIRRDVSGKSIFKSKMLCEFSI